MRVRAWRGVIPKVVVLCIATLVGAGAVAVASPATRSSASVGTVSFSTSPALYPTFSPAISDYVVRCTGNGPVQVNVTNSDGADATTTVSVDGQPPQTGSFVAPVSLRRLQEFSVQVSDGATTKDYFVRCLPYDFPAWTSARPGTPQAEYYVVAPSITGGPPDRYVVIYDTNGVPMWWFLPPPGLRPVDAKLAANGNILWTETDAGGVPLKAEEAQLDGTIVHDDLVPDGYPSDQHEVLLLANGNYVVMSYFPRCCYDLTTYGGSANATILDNAIQEVTPAGAAVWTWIAGDHLSLNEVEPQWWQQINDFGGISGTYDVFHMNSVEIDAAGDLLVSLRYVDVLKITNPTAATDPGKIIWKLGGSVPPTEGALLTIVGDPVFDGGSGFGGQHYARYFDAGDGHVYVTVHDNGSNLDRPPRGVRYLIDEGASTATLVEDVRDNAAPDSRSLCCGSAGKLPGGDWVASWGFGHSVMELTPAGDRVFVLTFNASSYRADPVLPGAVTRTTLRSGMDAQYAASIVDTDEDGCFDINELGTNPATGGERDPNDPNDWYDVPYPALRINPTGTRDGGIGVTTDLVALLAYSGRRPGNADYDADRDGDGVADGLQYDRSTSTTPGMPWRTGPPDGGIGITTDVVAMLAQTGSTCM